MKLSKPMRVLVGLGTAAYVGAPFVFAALVMVMAFVMSFLVLGSSRPEPPPEFAAVPFVFISVMFPLQCLFIALTLAMLAFYLIHVIKNNAAQETLRIVLGLGFVFLPFIAMPVYFFTYVWPERPPEWALAPAPPAS
jgi:hypothetical protein